MNQSITTVPPTPLPSASSAPALSPAPNPQVIEQYKAKLTDLGNLGARQTAMTTYYVSILSALLGVLAFKERPLSAVDPTIVLAVCIPGMLVSILWFSGVSFFRNLFRAKLRGLEDIEKSLPFQTFSSEYESIKAQGPSSWLRLERWIPAVFAAVFAGIAISRYWHPVSQSMKCLGR